MTKVKRIKKDDEFMIHDRVECDHYMEMPPLRGSVIAKMPKGMYRVELDTGGFKETFPPFMRHIEEDDDGKEKL